VRFDVLSHFDDLSDEDRGCVPGRLARGSWTCAAARVCRPVEGHDHQKGAKELYRVSVNHHAPRVLWHRPSGNGGTDRMDPGTWRPAAEDIIAPSA